MKTSKLIKLQIPLQEDEIRKLNVGDEVALTGTIVTGRDMAHTWLLEKEQPEVKNFLDNSCIYHCGPVVSQTNDKWSFVAAGPTTSIREEPYQAEVIKKYNIRGVIGKGGMGEKTLKALKNVGAVYFHAIGGAATVIAKSVKQVENVIKLDDFGVPEALWIINVKDLRVIVTMDSKGKSLHKDILHKSQKIRNSLIEK